MTAPRIYHLALRDEWDAAVTHGSYLHSTLGKSLAQVGFIHCSFADQVQTIADLVYAGRDDVMLLEIDPTAVAPDIRVEQADGTDEAFPHIYGPLSVAAVVSAHGVPLESDGRLAVGPIVQGS